MDLGNDRQKATRVMRKGRHVPLFMDAGLYSRLAACAEAIGATRQDLIRIALDEKLTELENRLGRGERLIIQRAVGVLVPAE